MQRWRTEELERAEQSYQKLLSKHMREAQSRLDSLHEVARNVLKKNFQEYSKDEQRAILAPDLDWTLDRFLKVSEIKTDGRLILQGTQFSDKPKHLIYSDCLSYSDRHFASMMRDRKKVYKANLRQKAYLSAEERIKVIERGIRLLENEKNYLKKLLRERSGK